MCWSRPCSCCRYCCYVVAVGLRNHTVTYCLSGIAHQPVGQPRVGSARLLLRMLLLLVSCGGGPAKRVEQAQRNERSLLDNGQCGLCAPASICLVLGKHHEQTMHEALYNKASWQFHLDDGQWSRTLLLMEGGISHQSFEH